MKINLARYTSPFSNPWAVIGESLLLPVLGIALGIWLNPLDPLWVESGFPWIWMAPMVLALRYGPFPGLAGAAMLLIAWLAIHLGPWNLYAGAGFPKIFFLGGLILVMLCGEFSSLWVARARRAETTQIYLDQRLEYVTHQYYLLRLSHDRLEQDLISRPMSMREALTTLRQITLESSGTLPGADALLRLLAQYCQLEVAALYATETQLTERLRTITLGLAREPVACLGQPVPLDLADPMLKRTLDDRSMWHVRNTPETAPPGAADNSRKTGPNAAPQSRYVIVAPLTTFDGERVGLLAVERLPFFALHNETLQTLDLLLGYYTDGLAMRRLAAPVIAAWPDCPPEFASELARLTRVARDSLIGSLIIALEFVDAPDAPTVGDMPMQIQRQKRLLDVNWLIKRPENPQRTVLLTIMPLAGESAAEGYLARVEQWIRPQRQMTLLQAGVFPHQRLIDGSPAVDQLNALLRLSHVAL